MASKSIRELQIGRELGVIVLAIRSADGQMHFNPTADTQVHAGEYLIVMGRLGNLRTLESLVAESRASRR
jgi:uncharacterized protein with PhoU and TrkA domain